MFASAHLDGGYLGNPTEHITSFQVLTNTFFGKEAGNDAFENFVSSECAAEFFINVIKDLFRFHCIYFSKQVL